MDMDPPTTDSEEELNSNSNGEKASKGRVRSRRKSIYKALTSQLEFYFSDANLSKSKFMIEVLKEKGPWLPTELFLKFNKVKSLLGDSFGCSVEEEPEKSLNYLTSALTKINSEHLEVSPEGLQVRRRIPFKGPSPDEEERTIYVENLPSYVTIDSLSGVFSQYGPVDYISLPKYKRSQQPKGFAFVEFRTLGSAQKALAAYGVCSSSSPSAVEEKDPSELQTVKSFQVEERENLLEDEEGSSSPNKEDKDDKMDPLGKAKKKRKRKKKEFHESEEDLQHMTLSVMSKTTWKKLRNKYLNLQRKNASQGKLRLKKLKQLDTSNETKARDEEAPPATEEKSIIPFAPNTVVRIDLEHMVDNPKVYKNRIRTVLHDPVKYVDVGIGNGSFFVRCRDDKQAHLLFELHDIFIPDGNTIRSMDLLTGEAEARYWTKIEKERLEKRSKARTRAKKQRGRDHLIEKMELAVNVRSTLND